MSPHAKTKLVGAGVDAVLTGGAPATRVVQKVTRTIPIVAFAEDLVLSGLVTSLAHPAVTRPASTSTRPRSTASGWKC